MNKNINSSDIMINIIDDPEYDDVTVEDMETVDNVMIDFVEDMEYADDEIYHDTLFSTVDNYIDDMVLETYNEECSNDIFNCDDGDQCNLPFNYIIDKTLEKLTSTNDINDHMINSTDPDFCEDIEVCNISPEDFQISVKLPDPEDYNHIEYGTDSYDDIFNA